MTRQPNCVSTVDSEVAIDSLNHGTPKSLLCTFSNSVANQSIENAATKPFFLLNEFDEHELLSFSEQLKNIESLNTLIILLNKLFFRFLLSDYLSRVHHQSSTISPMHESSTGNLPCRYLKIPEIIYAPVETASKHKLLEIENELMSLPIFSDIKRILVEDYGASIPTKHQLALFSFFILALPVTLFYSMSKTLCQEFMIWRSKDRLTSLLY